jgi:hypothetical protein
MMCGGGGGGGHCSSDGVGVVVVVGHDCAVRVSAGVKAHEARGVRHLAVGLCDLPAHGRLCLLVQAANARDGIAKFIYSALFQWLVRTIRRCSPPPPSVSLSPPPSPTRPSPLPPPGRASLVWAHVSSCVPCAGGESVAILSGGHREQVCERRQHCGILHRCVRVGTPCACHSHFPSARRCGVSTHVSPCEAQAQ